MIPNILFKQVIMILFLCNMVAEEAQNNRPTFYGYSAVSIDGDTIRMEEYKDRKILLVNVASKCGYTPQYKELEQLHKNHSNELIVLGFPSNDFLWQEPGSNDEIKTFCQRKYGVSFQMFEKIHVKGKKQHSLYKWLSDSELNGWNNKSPSWNFCKYLIDEKGELIDFFPSRVKPLDTTITRHLKSILPPTQKTKAN